MLDGYDTCNLLRSSLAYGSYVTRYRENGFERGSGEIHIASIICIRTLWPLLTFSTIDQTLSNYRDEKFPVHGEKKRDITNSPVSIRIHKIYSLRNANDQLTTNKSMQHRGQALSSTTFYSSALGWPNGWSTPPSYSVFPSPASTPVTLPYPTVPLFLVHPSLRIFISRPRSLENLWKLEGPPTGNGCKRY